MNQESELSAAKQEIAALKAEIQRIQDSSLERDALAELSDPRLKIIAPRQFYTLFGKGRIKRDEKTQRLIVDDGGLPKSISDWASGLALDAENRHHFQQQQTEQKQTGPTTNPFARGTWNLTEQGQLYRRNPEIARQLKAEAAQAR